MTMEANAVSTARVALTAYELAQRFVGVREVPGAASNPQVLAMLKLDAEWAGNDEVPWCSAFVNYIAWLLRLPRSKNLRARSWLEVGMPVAVEAAEIGFDVVVLQRGEGVQPGPEDTNAPGHVGFYAGTSGDHVVLLGGNQKDAVRLSMYLKARILGVRRIAPGLG